MIESLQFITGVFIGTGIGFLLAEIFDSKDGKIKGLKDRLKESDETIYQLSLEKQKLQDENFELKQNYKQEGVM